MHATISTGPPAHGHVPGDRLADYPLNTEQFAARNLVDAKSVRARLCRTGSYHGIRPLKLASGRTLWPDLTATYEGAAHLHQEGRRHA
jgi:hypothetical protein